MCDHVPAQPGDSPPSLPPQPLRLPIIRRIYRDGRGWSLRVPGALLRHLGIPAGGTVLLRPLPSGGFGVEPLSQGVDLGREQLSQSSTLAQLVRENVRLRRRAARVEQRTFAQGISIGYSKALSALHIDLASFLDAWRAGRVMVLPVTTESGDQVPEESLPFPDSQQ